MREALEAGQPVVTANKAVIAKSGSALLKVAARRGVRLSFEAAVAGGVPIIRSLRQGLASDRITSIRGILNGTTNFILSEMARGGTYDSALARAQELGFAEADPTLDVEGYDAADKIRILAALGFGAQVAASKVSVEGITNLTPETMADAGRLGMTIKLIASAERVGEGVALAVSPSLVEVGHPLSAVPSAQNAIAIESDALGLTHFQGPGAGGLPTGSAVVADLLETARDLSSQAPLTLPGIFLPDAPKVLNSNALETRAYIRVMVNDRPGVLSELTGILADEGISISTMVQDDPTPSGALVPVVLTTYRAAHGALVRATKRFIAQSCKWKTYLVTNRALVTLPEKSRLTSRGDPGAHTERRSFDVAAKPETVFQVISDFERYPEFLPEIREARFDRQDNESALAHFDLFIPLHVRYSLSSVVEPQCSRGTHRLECFGSESGNLGN